MSIGLLYWILWVLWIIGWIGVWQTSVGWAQFGFVIHS